MYTFSESPGEISSSYNTLKLWSYDCGTVSSRFCRLFEFSSAHFFRFSIPDNVECLLCVMSCVMLSLVYRGNVHATKLWSTQNLKLKLINRLKIFQPKNPHIKICNKLLVACQKKIEFNNLAGGKVRTLCPNFPTGYNNLSVSSIVASLWDCSAV